MTVRISVALIIVTILGCFSGSQQAAQSYFAIEERGVPQVVVTDNQYGTGVSIFQEDSGSPYVTVLDSDSDGILDFIEYFVLDEADRYVYRVTLAL